MVSWIICKAVVLVFGMLYPAYSSYKAVRTKNVKEYVRWMMYWIVFALYTVTEAIADLTLSWFPLYYELKIAFVVWLLSPYTRGASLLYRKFLHPLLSSKEKFGENSRPEEEEICYWVTNLPESELVCLCPKFNSDLRVAGQVADKADADSESQKEIDDYIVQAKEKGYETMVHFGKQGLNLAANAAVTAAVKGQGAITERLRSFSMHDLTAIQGDETSENRPFATFPDGQKKARASVSDSSGFGSLRKDSGDDRTDEDVEVNSEDEVYSQKGLRRSQSMRSVKVIKGRKEIRYASLKHKPKKRPQLYFREDTAHHL